MYCTACKYTFKNDEEQSNHYKLEWHRFNVKRRCDDLLPIDRVTYDEKVNELQRLRDDAQRSYTCQYCSKEFSQENSYKQHLRSKKHAKRVEHLASSPKTVASSSSEKNDVPMDIDLSNEKRVVDESRRRRRGDDDDDDDGALDFSKAIPLNQCLFCGVQCNQLQQCLDHMLKKHGFFVPFIEYLHDLEGLLEYLGAKVGVGHVCLYCNGRGRAAYASLQAVRQHMESKNHCKLRFEEDEEDDEFDEFYRFPGDVDEHDNDDDGVHDDDESMAAKRRVESINDLGELVLTDGTLLGHRNNRVYYKQSLVPETKESILLKELLAQYKMIGLPGYTMRDKKKHSQIPKKVRRRHDQQRLKLGIKNNNMAHFKDATGAF